ncbi:restriction endonuclease [Kitasatospora sp. NPDC101157]|uniref:restriction endonuclease n=1 Tax=Kitasatospora sp. NPDC101157 TaxID=3364098 RepID=UPI0037F62F08
MQTQTGSLADSVERILKRHHRGPLSTGDLHEMLSREGDTLPELLVAEEQLLDALREDDRQRSARGYRERFVVTDGRSVRLRAPATPAEDAVEAWNKKVKGDLLVQLKQCDPILFEQIVARLLTAIGYTGVQVTKRSNDGGIDIHAILSAGGVTNVPTALQVKRWGDKSVGRREVQQLRGALKSRQQGVLVTTSRFAATAIKDAAREDANPVHLIDGDVLVDLMVEHGLGVQTSRLAFFSLDEGLLAGSTSASSTDLAAPATAAPVRDGAKYLLAKLPELGDADYLTVIAEMLALAEGQPTLDEYVNLFQERFERITREDEARRRMRSLVSLGLVVIENDHVILTFLGRRVLTEHSLSLMQETFMARIAGAEEIASLHGRIPEQGRLQKELDASPPAGLSSTQAQLVLRWLKRLELVV